MNDPDRKTSQVPPTRDALVEMTIEEVLTRWPQTAVIFHQHNMACVGCAVAGFYTVVEAASVYNLPLEQFLGELVAVIGQSEA